MSIPQFTKDLMGTLEKRNMSKDFEKKIVFPKGTSKGATEKKKGLIYIEKKAKFEKEYEAKCDSWIEEKEMQLELLKSPKREAKKWIDFCIA